MAFYAFLKHFIAVSIIGLLSLLYFSPALSHVSSNITDPVDGLYTVWAIHRIQDNFLTGRNIFEGNIFYPTQQTLVFSDTFATSAFILLPLRLITKEPIPMFTFNLVLSMILTGFAAYLFFLLLLTRQGIRRHKEILALVFSIVFNFSQAHIEYVGHLHVFAIQYVLFAIDSLLLFWISGKPKWLFLAAVMCTLQAWQSIFLLYYVIFSFLLLCLFPSFLQAIRKNLRYLLLCGAFFFFASIPIFMAYLGFYNTYHVVRDIREAIHFSLVFHDLIGQFFSPIAYGILGISFLLLFIPKNKGNRYGKFFLFGGSLLFILSLGPALHISDATTKLQLFGHILHIPLPYTLLYYVAPGFKSFRTPSRFFPLSLFYFLTWSFLNLSSKKWVHIYITPLAILVIGLSFLILPQLKVYPIPSIHEYPSYVRWLKARPEQIVLHLPIHDWADKDTGMEEIWMLYSLEDKKTLVNGASGYFPDEWFQFQNTIHTGFPSTYTANLVQQRGVELIVIQKDTYQSKIQEIEQIYSAPIYEDSQVWIFKVRKNSTATMKP